MSPLGARFLLYPSSQRPRWEPKKAKKTKILSLTLNLSTSLATFPYPIKNKIIEVYMIKLLIALVFSLSLNAKMIDYNIKPDNLHSDRYMDITILDSKELKFNNYKNIKFREISDLAYRNNILYGVSDKANLFKFKIKIESDKIKSLYLDDAVNLHSKKGHRLFKEDRDSEGLTFMGDKLLISFEKNPRVELFSLHGKEIKNISIDKKLRNIDNYVSHNKALEAVAYNKKFSVVTAPELPLDRGEYHTLYSKNRNWKFKKDGSITALEFINKNKILVLERDFNHFTRARKTVLSVINLDKCKKKLCKKRVVALLTSGDNWNLDNFEGLTKIAPNRFLMISDDNESFFQKTLLVLFKLDI
jgi:hypothetical protein